MNNLQQGISKEYPAGLRLPGASVRAGAILSGKSDGTISGHPCLFLKLHA